MFRGTFPLSSGQARSFHHEWSAEGNRARLIGRALPRRKSGAYGDASSRERALPACTVRHPAGPLFPGRMPGNAPKMGALPMTHMPLPGESEKKSRPILQQAGISNPSSPPAGWVSPQSLILKTEMEPRMDADKHGFSGSYSKPKPHSKDEFDDWHNSLFISVHQCLSVVLFSFLG